MKHNLFLKWIHRLTNVLLYLVPSAMTLRIYVPRVKELISIGSPCSANEINMISPCVLVICTRLIVTFDISIYITRCCYLFYFKLTSHDGVARVDLNDIRTCFIDSCFCFTVKLIISYHFTSFIVNNFYIRRHIRVCTNR